MGFVEDILAQSIADLREDLEGLDQLARSSSLRVAAVQSHLLKHPEHVSLGAREAILEIAQTCKAQCDDIRIRIAASLPMDDLDALIVAKRDAADRLRSVQGMIGAVSVSADWQSPSFLASAFPQAGTEVGKITGTLNDYKRDHHSASDAYEKAFRRAYIDAPFPVSVNAYATSSGMAAFSTVLQALHGDTADQSPILAGENGYFENKHLLRAAYGERLNFVDELNTEAILAEVDRLQPSAIFLDTLCNTEEIPVADFALLIPRLARAVKRSTYLVLDNSGLSTSFQPARYLPLIPSRLHLVVFESLNKYHQFGFDRVTGGIICTYGLATPPMFGTRMHSGTNIPDASVASLPEPNRTLLDRRLQRLTRNAQILAESLEAFLSTSKGLPVERVVYPGLPSYKGYAWTRRMPFHGSFLTLGFHPDSRRPSVYRRFLAAAINEAKREGIPLIAGSSFGFDTTRVYLTALHARKNDAQPFLRISAGTESLIEISRVAQVLSSAMASM